MFRTVVLLVCLAASATPYEDEPIFSRGDSIFLKTGEVSAGPTCPQQLYSCANCNTARLCVPSANGTWQFMHDIPCPADTPYCDKATGTCGLEPNSDCGQKDNFVCTQDGYMPDNTDCSKYHVCKSYAVNSFQCVNKTYDPELKDCVLSSDACSPFDCRGQAGRKVPHKKYDSYFAYCFGETASVVDRCVGNYVLNVTSQVCEPPCKSNGAVASNDGCTKYFTCSMVYYKKDIVIPELTPQECPKGMGFDPVHLVCTTNIAGIPNCKV